MRAKTKFVYMHVLPDDIHTPCGDIATLTRAEQDTLREALAFYADALEAQKFDRLNLGLSDDSAIHEREIKRARKLRKAIDQATADDLIARVG